ncbi:MAG: S-layer homology domain-containing protein [Clostridia bacterium]|nr:MAG: S-layer homology domain-containing protein [Clostridia bacterium]
MAYFTRNRYAAGNICFVLFLAFLFSLAFTGMPANAAPTVSEGSKPSSPQGGGVVEVSLTPTTATEFSTVIGQIVQHLGTIDNLVSSIVYNQVYRTAYGVAYEIYNYVVWLVYGPPDPGYTVETDTYRITYQGLQDNKLQSVTVEVPVPVPISGGDGGGGGGGGGTVTPSTQTTTTGFGQTTVNTSTGAVEVAVDAGKFAGLLQQAVASGAQAVVIKPEIPANVTVKEVSVPIPAAAVTAATQAGKDIRVEVAGVAVVLPPQVVPAQLLADATAKVSLNIQVLEQTQAQVLTRDLPSGLAVAANILELDLSVVRGTQSEKVALAKPVTVSIPYTAVAGVEVNKLGVYRYNEDTLEWAYVGGRVDRAAKTVSTRLSSFSKYTVMAYDKTFADIQLHWAKKDIELMASRWIARGMTETTFEPEGQVTRAQFAALLTRSLGIAEAKEGQSRFKDVSSGDWFYGAVLAAYEAGLVKGYEDGTFRPNANITREEMATMVARGLAYAGKKVDVTGKVDTLLAKFTDRNQISGWAREAAAVAVQEGIVKGRTATTYVPRANATRAESTVMLKRLLVSTGEIGS